MALLHSFGRASNLHINEIKTVGIWYGLDDPETIPALANITWLKEGEQRTSLGIAVGKRLDVSVQSLAIEECCALSATSVALDAPSTVERCWLKSRSSP